MEQWNKSYDKTYGHTALPHRLGWRVEGEDFCFWRGALRTALSFNKYPQVCTIECWNRAMWKSLLENWTKCTNSRNEHLLILTIFLSHLGWCARRQWTRLEDSKVKWGNCLLPLSQRAPSAHYLCHPPQGRFWSWGNWRRFRFGGFWITLWALLVKFHTSYFPGYIYPGVCLLQPVWMQYNRKINNIRKHKTTNIGALGISREKKHDMQLIFMDMNLFPFSVFLFI